MKLFFFINKNKTISAKDENESVILECDSNNNDDDFIFKLLPYKDKNFRANILAILSISHSYTAFNKYNIYWEPGYKPLMKNMENFDNYVKRKADFTLKWIKNILLPKSRCYYEKHKKLFCGIVDKF